MDPIKNIDPAGARRRLDETRAAFIAAESAANDAIAAADAAGEPRWGGLTNSALHVAERDAIEALLEASGPYEVALQTYKTLIHWRD